MGCAGERPDWPAEISTSPRYSALRQLEAEEVVSSGRDALQKGEDFVAGLVRAEYAKLEESLANDITESPRLDQLHTKGAIEFARIKH